MMDSKATYQHVEADAFVTGDELCVGKGSPTTLQEMLHWAASTRFSASKIIILKKTQKPQELTYVELYTHAQHICAGLQAQGLVQGDKVILQLQDPADFILAFWGSVLGGIVPILLNIQETVEGQAKLQRIQQAFDDPLRITQQVLMDLSQRMPTQCADLCYPKPDDIAILLLTSGSTSASKYVVQTHHSLICMATAMTQMNRLSSEDVIFNWLPMGHVGAVALCHLLSMWLGSTQVMSSPEYVLQNPVFWLDVIEEYAVSLTWAPNFAYNLLIDSESEILSRQRDLSSMRFLINGGELVNINTLKKLYGILKTYGLKKQAICPVFGMSETASAVAWANGDWEKTLERDGVTYVSVGQPLPGNALRIVDEHDQLLLEGNIGNLQMTGEMMTKGYYSNGVVSTDTFTQDGWLRTGDLGCVWKGMLFVTGRSKNVIVIRGEKYYCHEIEKIVEQVEGVMRSYTAACGVRKNQQDEEVLAIFLHHSALSTDQVEKLKRNIRQKVTLAFGINPSYIVCLPKESIPKTDIGKIKRAQLKKQFEAGAFRDLIEKTIRSSKRRTSSPPKTETEINMVEIWKNILGVSDINRQDNFFELGGSSLQAIRLIGQIEQRFGVHVELNTIFHAQHLQALCVNINTWSQQGKQRPKKVLLDRAVRTEDFLSEAQKTIWLDALFVGQAVYNIAYSVQITGDLDLSILEDGINQIVWRHTILHTVFENTEEGVKQRIKKPNEVKVQYEDLQELDSKAQKKQITQIGKKLTHKSFALSTLPLMRTVVMQIRKQEYIWLMVLPHIIFDGPSFEILMRKLTVVYINLVSQQKQKLPNLPVQYLHFVDWEKRFFDNIKVNERLTFWKEKLHGIERLRLFSDYPRPQERSTEGKTVFFTLPDKLSNDANSYSRQNNVSLYGVMLTAFFVLLYEYTAGQHDLVVGTPFSNRSLPEFEEMLGLFVNTLPIRMHVKSTDRMQEMMRQVMQCVVEAYDHNLPLHQIVSKINPRRDAGHSALFDVLFVMNHSAADFVQLPQIIARESHFDSGYAKYDLTLFVVESQNNLELHFEYNRDLFLTSSIRNMVKIYCNILKAIVRQSAASQLKDLSLTSHDVVLKPPRHNSHDGAFRESVLVLFERQVLRYPNQIAVMDNVQSLTFTQLNQKTNQMARYLKKMGVQFGDVVALCLDRSVAVVIALLGILKANAVYLPLDPETPSQRKKFIIDETQCSVIVTNSNSGCELEKISREKTIRTIDLNRDEKNIDLEKKNNLHHTISPTDLAYIIYTSGSSGYPKGVLVEHQSLSNVVVSVQNKLGVSCRDRFLAITSLTFDVSLLDYFLSLCCGAQVIIADSNAQKNADKILRLLAVHQISIMQATPTVWRVLLENGWGGEKLFKILSAGEALDSELTRKLMRCGQVYNLYGPTEAAVYTTIKHIQNARVPAIGQAIDHMQTIVLHPETGQVVPAGVPGELYIGGVGVTRGYLNRPELNAQHFITEDLRIDDQSKQKFRLYRTGDLVKIIPRTGDLLFLGRKDDQIKLRGFRIELAEIEAVLNRHPMVQQAAVILTDSLPKKLIVYCVLREQMKDTDHTVDMHSVVSNWEQVYNNLYARHQTPGEQDWLYAGWASSYTGRAFSTEDMQEWIQNTVDRIRQLKPRVILEVGCGTGLLLRRLMPVCTRYLGTDVSETVIDALKLDQAIQTADNVELYVAAADTLCHLPALQNQTLMPDVVLLNSVIQYFPNAAYLQKVLDSLIKYIQDGKIFIGDVRDYRLLETFYYSIQKYQHPEYSEAKCRLYASMKSVQEKELLLSPGFFIWFAQQTPQVNCVEILPKLGQMRNEMNHYRYDVILHITSHTNCELDCASGDTQIEWMQWCGELPWLENILSAGKKTTFAVQGYPNIRLQDGVAPDIHGLCKLAEQYHYSCKISLSLNGTAAEKKYDVIFYKYAHQAEEPLLHLKRYEWYQHYRNVRFSGRLSNDPSSYTMDLSAQLKTVKNYLVQYLPHYMIPTDFVLLPKMPINASGKLDRVTLSEVLPATMRPGRKIEAPEGGAEQTLMAIWCDILGADSIDVNDNFFGLGGDSIMVMQVVSRARLQQLYFTAQQFYTHPTIRSLVQSIAPNKAQDQLQLLATGMLKLSPVQQWFFAQEFGDVHHFNQSVLLNMHQKLNLEELNKILSFLTTEHDSFRLRYAQNSHQKSKQQHKGSTDWRQGYVKNKKAVSFHAEYIDLSSVEMSEAEQIIRSTCESLENSLDISAGPLLQAALFETSVDFQQSLFITVHHLIMDGVSWRIFLEDFSYAYQKITAGNSISSLQKSVSYKAWTNALIQYARGQKIQTEIPYWLNVADKILAMPISQFCGQRFVQTFAQLEFEWSIEDTAKLRNTAANTWQAGIDELLLSAWLLADYEHFHYHTICLNMEGHGREESVGKLDLSRTIGWFTSIFPIVFQLPNKNKIDVADVLQIVQLQLNAMPNHGIGYGILRYLQKSPHLKKLENLDALSVRFNYLGEIFTSDMFSLSENHFYLSSDACNPAGYAIQLNSAISHGKLWMRLEYDTTLYQASGMERLLKRWVSHIAEFIHVDQYTSKTSLPIPSFVAKHLSKNDVTRLEQDLPDTNQITSLYPLSPMQEGILFHILYAPEAHEYCTQLYWEYDTDVNPVILKKAWSKVIDQHPILRTAIHWEGLSIPIQVVYRNVSVPWHKEDWLSYTADEQRKLLKDYLKKDRDQAFHLMQPCLMRLHCIRLSAKKSLFIWTHSHLIVDGWSFPILLQTLSAYCSHFLSGESVNFPDSPAYEDYIRWLYQQDTQIAEEYWRHLLRDIDKPAELGINIMPLDIHKPIDDLQELKYTLSEKLTKKLHHFAQKNCVTLSACLNLAWGAMLSQYSRQKDVVFGCTVSGRTADLPGIEHMVGLCINTLPMVVRLKDQSTVLEQLKWMHQQIQSSGQYGYLSLNRIQRHSAISTELPLFYSLLVFENYPLLSSLQVQVKNIQIHDKTNYPLVLFAIPGERLGFKISYDAACFESAMIQNITAHLENILIWLIEHPTDSLNKIDILGMSSRRQMLQGWAQSDRAIDVLGALVPAFEQQVNNTPNKTAIISDGSSISYLELNRAVNHLADLLQEKNVCQNVVVGIFMNRTIDIVIAILAILKSGGAYLSLDVSYPKDRLEYMVRDARVQIVLVSICANWRCLRQLRLSIMTVHGKVLQHANKLPKMLEMSVPCHLAYVTYTSGTSGRPKGVMITRENLRHAVSNFIHVLGLKRDHVFLALTPLSFDISVLELLLPSLIGATIVLLGYDKLFQNKNLHRMIETHAINVVQATPSMWSALLADLNPNQTFKIKALSGGEELPMHLARKLLDLGCDLWNMYGPVEATIWATAAHIRRFTAEDLASNLESQRVEDEYVCNLPADGITIGRPFPNVCCYVLNESLLPVPAGIVGILYIGGKLISLGYLGDDEKTKQKFIPNPYATSENETLYCTGDLVRWHANGQLEFVGREDHQVKVRGVRIELEEIDSTILLHHNIIQAATILLHKGQPNKERLITFYVSADQTIMSSENVRTFLLKHLPPVVVPTDFIGLDTMPMSTFGKVDRHALILQADINGRNSQKSSCAVPSTTLEKQLCRIWETVLQHHDIVPEDNFFDLGGHSLHSLHILALAKAQSINLTLEMFYQYPTVRELSRHIEKNVQPVSREMQYSCCYLLNQVTGKLPNLFCVHPINGAVYWYYQLAENLETDYYFYGISSPILEGKNTLCNGVMGLAKQYLTAVQSVQPEGPYYLAGWSFGGLVAFEMARLLENAGEDVKFLGLIDPTEPATKNLTAYQKTLFAQVVLDFERWCQLDMGDTFILNVSSVDEMLQALKERIKDEVKAHNALTEEALDNLLTVYAEHLQALCDYQISGTVHNLVVFQATQSQLGQRIFDWSLYAKNLQTYALNGNHYSILRDGLVKKLAALVRSAK